jgi:hypothetical protein
METDGRGMPLYDDEQSISCRKSLTIQTVKNKDGEAVQSKAVYYTIDNVNVDDLIDGTVILSVAEWKGLDGKVIGYKAVV